MIIKNRNTAIPKFVFALFILLLFSANTLIAEQITIVKEYSYQANENDSKISSRIIAIDQVKMLISYELSASFLNVKELKNLKFTKDQMVILVSGMIEPEIIEEKWDGKTYYLKAKISLDPDRMIQLIDTVHTDREMSKDLEETRKESERIRKELETTRLNKKKQEEYFKAIKQLSTTDWVEKGYALRNSGNYMESIEAFNNAIEINPHYARAYVGRSGSYRRLGQYEQAIKDADMAIRLDQNFAVGYSNRGLAYASLGSYQQAIQNYEKAIELDPGEAKTFYYRGFAYKELGKYQLALGDFNMALELDPNYAAAYFNRGIILNDLGDYRQSVESFKTAARLGYKPAQDRLISEKIKW
jgi:tetratricopeptide (TPR) repeat protein